MIEQTEESTNPRQTADDDPNLVDLPHGQAHESVEPQNLFGRSCYLEKRDPVFVQHIAHLGGVDVAVRRPLKHGIHAFMGDIETILDRQHVVLSAVPIDDQLRIPRIVFVVSLVVVFPKKLGTSFSQSKSYSPSSDMKIGSVDGEVFRVGSRVTSLAQSR